MANIFDALKQMPKRGPKVHTVCISGQNVVVTLEKKLEVIKHGEEAYHWISPTEFALKPPPKLKTQHKTLIKADKGYYFHDNDIHWPKKIAEGGVTWQIEHE